jgi:hypothetical protein
MAGSKNPRIEYRCSFCGKSQPQVLRLIAGPGGVYICNECVDLCQEIISDEGMHAKVKGDRSMIEMNAESGRHTGDKCPLCGGLLGDDPRVVVAMYERDVDPVVDREVIWRCHATCYEKARE